MSRCRGIVDGKRCDREPSPAGGGSRELCGRCYQRQRRHGNAHVMHAAKLEGARAITVRLPGQDFSALEELAHTRRQSVGEVLRDAVRAFLGRK